MSVSYQDNTAVVKAMTQQKASLALKLATDDVLRISRPNTPKADTNFLRNNTKKQVLGLKGKITWSARYAQYQERGMRRDGTHVVRNYTTGGTGKHFALNAMKQVTKNRMKYFRKVI